MNREIVITVATYKRPDLLSELLRSLEKEHRRTAFTVIVIDNDASGSGEAVVASSDLPITYAIEPVPGIVAARNAALDRLPATATHVVFVDDDETVSEGWLDELLRAEERYGADVVCGPVLSVFPDDSPRWIRDGGYIQRSNESEGVTNRVPATNNTLVTTALLHRAGDPRFDEAFSHTGGSDTAFFTPLIAGGARVAWAPSALVSERVPSNRLTFKWVMRRYIRVNNVSGRMMLATTSRPVLLSKALASIAYGVAKTTFAVVRGKGLRLVDTRYVTRGLGWLGAVSDRLVQEYSRPGKDG
ncbi:succinoglycan biosynthesis protein ExoM [Rathayibacter sp. PhB152]|uniref:glycosyltransferase family 2 protein n=1 Tax=Rathayibacter sp. PhB152 TaxID=2485190 RepID=UPI000F8FBF43|nr:glycosyltransferase [Rathayibacter sp. PhB152]ROQ63872.1 succinoglycan biosynthesis protein ExoM [Rathayibacter sp. PhB152]